MSSQEMIVKLTQLSYHLYLVIGRQGKHGILVGELAAWCFVPVPLASMSLHQGGREFQSTSHT